MKRISGSTILKVLPLLAIAALCTTDAQSQPRPRYQAIFRATGNEVAHGVANSLGESQLEPVIVGEKPSTAGDKDIYVAKISRCGDQIWAFSYDIGGDDIAYKAEQTSDLGYIIVGQTENTGRGCTTNDVFLMKISSVGLVQWVRTYGGQNNDEGRDIVIPVRGPNEYYVVAGRTNSYGHGGYDGFLMRVDNTGNIVWSWAYGGQQDDEFLACTIGDVTVNNGIVAVGSTRSFTPPSNNLDIYKVGVDLASGFPSTSSASHYGDDNDQIGRSVASALNGDVVIAGQTNYGTALPANSYGYILRTDGPGTFLCDMIYSGTSSGQEAFHDIKPFFAGDRYYVTGSVYNITGGFGGYDVYFAEVDGCFNPPYRQYVFGGTGDEYGYESANINAVAEPHYATAASTTSFGATGTDGYVVGHRFDGDSQCNFNDVSMTTSHPYMPGSPAPGGPMPAMVACEVSAIHRQIPLWVRLCSACDPQRAPAQDAPELSSRDDNHEMRQDAAARPHAGWLLIYTNEAPGLGASSDLCGTIRSAYVPGKKFSEITGTVRTEFDSVRDRSSRGRGVKLRDSTVQNLRKLVPERLYQADLHIIFLPALLHRLIEKFHGVLLVICFQLVVQIGIASLELPWFFEKGLRCNGEKFRRAGGAVRIEHAHPPQRALALQAGECLAQHP